MKGLMKYLSPFAPDQSGAVSVLFAMGGIIVIMDAGGCAGNICGFDEPRWLEQLYAPDLSGGECASSVFSAGLRDMDAILGRDEALILKTADAAAVLEANFIALIGTPVPAVIGTDYTALKRMAEKKLSLPIIAVPTGGIQLYDKGQEETYLAIIREFAGGCEKGEPDEKIVGVLGASGLERTSREGFGPLIRRLDPEGKLDVRIFGDRLQDFRELPAVGRNVVVSPSGITAAEYLKDRFGTPYEIEYPLPETDGARFVSHPGRKILIIHQAVLASALKKRALEADPSACVCTATFFMPLDGSGERTDIVLKDEDDLADIAVSGGFDIIAGDPLFSRALTGLSGLFVPLPHFPVSGSLHVPASESEFLQAFDDGLFS